MNVVAYPMDNGDWALNVALFRRHEDILPLESIVPSLSRALDLLVVAGVLPSTFASWAPRPTPAELAYQLPAPRGYQCAAKCGHGIAMHRAFGCDVEFCSCPAPFGRILPDSTATFSGVPSHREAGQQ